MANKYKELFEKIAPQKSDEELLSAVLDRKAVNMSEKKRFNKKAVIIPAAAAAVLAVTTVGVSAAYEWDIPAAFSSIFSKSPKADNGESNFEFNDFDFAELGGEVLDQRFECDGYTIQMRGIIADMHTALICYDIILDEGHVFPYPLAIGDPLGYTYTKGDEIYIVMWQENSLDMFNEYLEQNRNPDGTLNYDNIDNMGSDYKNIMLKADGNIIHCAHRHDLKKVSFKDREILYRIIGLHANSGGRYFNVNSENDDFLTINFDFIQEDNEITVDGNSTFSLEGGERGTVSSVHITPLSLDLNIDWEKGKGPLNYLEAQNNTYREIKVRFKNGTIAENYILDCDEHGSYKLDYSTWERRVLTQELYLHWKYPVNISDIDAIIIGNGEFKIN